MTDSIDNILGLTEGESEQPTINGIPVVVDENVTGDGIVISEGDPTNMAAEPEYGNPQSPSVGEVAALTELRARVTDPEHPEPATPQLDILDAIMQRVAPAGQGMPWLRILIYGPPGCRKTTFCGRAPKTFIYETDSGGQESLLNFPETAQTPILPFKSTFQLNTMVDAMLAGDPRMDFFDTFCIDTYTMYQAKDLGEIPRLGDGRPNYQLNTENLKTLTDRLRNIPKHLILTAHVKEEKDETTGVVLRRPELTPKVSQAVVAMMGVIGYMTVDGDNWNLQLQPSPGVSAKCRVGGLPATLPNPSFQQILDARTAMIATNTQ